MFRNKIYLSILSCFAIVLILLIVANNFWEKPEQHINSDGRGYYEYLPATFIYGDLKLNYLDTLECEYYDSQIFQEKFYPKINGTRHNKYFIGTAVLQLPSFLLTHFFTKIGGKHKADGFSKPYQNASYYNALLFLFLGLFFLFETLKSYRISYPLIVLILLGLVFCTSLPLYVYQESAFSHVYSFALISFFIFSVRKYLLNKASKYIYFTIISLFIIVLIRPVNILVILFLPFLFESFSVFASELKTILQTKKKVIFISICIGFPLLFLQSLVWRFSYGTWFSYPYGNEGFIWGHKHFLDFLFSVRKGFFFWSPWFFVFFFIATFSCLVLKKHTLLLLFYLPFYVLIFVLSSWWYWAYGGTLGSRPMIDFYPLFILFGIPFLQSFKKFSILVLSLTFLVFTPILLTQLNQFQRYILKQDEMTWSEYKEIFMQDETEWEGYLYRKNYNISSFQIKDKLISNSLIFDSKTISRIDSVDIFNYEQKKLLVTYSFQSSNKSENNCIELILKDSLGEIYDRKPSYLITTREHPKIKNKHVIQVELPNERTFTRIILNFQHVNQKSEIKNLKFNLAELK